MQTICRFTAPRRARRASIAPGGGPEALTMLLTRSPRERAAGDDRQSRSRPAGAANVAGQCARRVYGRSAPALAGRNRGGRGGHGHGETAALFYGAVAGRSPYAAHQLGRRP